MFHLTRCCLCVTMFAVTSAFAQTSPAPTEQTAKNEVKAKIEFPYATVRMLNRVFPQYKVTIERKSNAQEESEHAQNRKRPATARTAEDERTVSNSTQRNNRREKMIQMVVSVQPLIHQGLNEEDILSALSMISEVDEDPSISTRFHRPTGLVFIKTRFEQMTLVEEVMRELEITAYTGPEPSFTGKRNRFSRN